MTAVMAMTTARWATDSRACHTSQAGKLEGWLTKFKLPTPDCSLDQARFVAENGQVEAKLDDANPTMRLYVEYEDNS